MAIAAGIRCDVDPLLANVMKTHCGKWEEMEGGGEGGRRKMLMYRTEHLYTRQLSHFTSSFTPSLPHSPTHQTRARRTTMCGVCTLSSWQ